MNVLEHLKNGIFRKNVLLRLMIGLCSALAVSTSVENAFFMGMAASFVLVMSNVIISLLRKLIPNSIRIPIFIVIISSFVTIVDLTLKAYFPEVYQSLGVWIPLIVVNCMILGRAEAFASRNGVLWSAIDGIATAMGFTLVLLMMGIIRELLGTGKIVMFDRVLVSLGQGFLAPTFMITFPGAFLTFGLLAGLLNKLESKVGS